MVSIYIRNKRN